MVKDICKFDLLLVSAGSACIDSIGMTIYTRCPNFKLHIAGNLSEALNKTKLVDFGDAHATMRGSTQRDAHATMRVRCKALKTQLLRSGILR